MKTIRVKLFFSVILLLTVAVCGIGLLYTVCNRELYIAGQCDYVDEAYQELVKQDLEELCRIGNQQKEVAAEEENPPAADRFLEGYENENLRFRIRDSSFSLLYDTYKSAAAREENYTQEEKNFRIKRYQENDTASYEKVNGNGRIMLRSRVEQNGKTYYVMILESTLLIDESISYANRVLVLVLLLFISIGGLAVNFLAKRISRPVTEVSRIARMIAGQDFSERASVKTGYRELDELGTSVNLMSSQLQKSIEDMKNYNEMLQKEIARRTELENHRKQFVNNVSHELKTPLAIISSQMEMIPLIRDEKKRQEYCGSVVEEVNRMNQMLHSMLTIFSAEQGIEDMAMEEVNVSRIAAKELEDFGPLFARRKLILSAEIQKERKAWGNGELLRRAVDNYLMNASRHTVSGGSVQVSLSQEGEKLRFSVYNDGEKISLKDQSKIWDSFYQGSVLDGKSQGEGTGLGLYIVKSVVAQHDGRCGVENREKGVEFWFEIPVIPEGRK
ncbi:MAG TPA: HAMP domain-containing histidine kinase [Candidatus Choladousia intestinigallinarum]|nr:HAMP domain-containing histidine kinase [Candidatus Choladousia intestinigallinarum]